MDINFQKYFFVVSYIMLHIPMNLKSQINILKQNILALMLQNDTEPMYSQLMYDDVYLQSTDRI